MFPYENPLHLPLTNPVRYITTMPQQSKEGKPIKPHPFLLNRVHKINTSKSKSNTSAQSPIAISSPTTSLPSPTPPSAFPNSLLDYLYPNIHSLLHELETRSLKYIKGKLNWAHRRRAHGVEEEEMYKEARKQIVFLHNQLEAIDRLGQAHHLRDVREVREWGEEGLGVRIEKGEVDVRW
jgi:hypothetical protein